MSITGKFLRAPGPIEISGCVRPQVDRLHLGAGAARPRAVVLVRHILEPDLPDLTGYINDTLPESRTGGAR